MTAIFSPSVFVRAAGVCAYLAFCVAGRWHHMLLMAAVNPLNDPDDFIDERQRLTLTYAATMVVDDEDASFSLQLPLPAPLDWISPESTSQPSPPVVNAACAAAAV